MQLPEHTCILNLRSTFTIQDQCSFSESGYYSVPPSPGMQVSIDFKGKLC